MKENMENSIEHIESLDNNLSPDITSPKSPSIASDTSEKIYGKNLIVSEDSGDDVPKKRNKKHIQRLVDSDSEEEQQTNEQEDEIDQKLANSGSENDTSVTKSVPRTRIQLANDSGSESSENITEISEQQLRLRNKNNKMKNKFKSLLSSRGKVQSPNDENNSNESGKDVSNESADEEAAAIEEIKKKIKERMSSFKSSICDPDTSDEETQQQQIVHKQKKERRSTKMTSPKPQRMSAKQAMENMHKIKSESNRMLREKEVSLPYHRPKALTLKDIMSRRQPALSSDGKSLPIKMNEKQLQQYAQMLEERQKKMMELWQSESDDDNENDEKDDTNDIHTVKNVNNEITITEAIASKLNYEIEKNEELKESITTQVEIHPISNVDQISPSKPNHEIQSDTVLEEQDSETNINLRYNDSETSINEDNINKSVDAAFVPISTKITTDNSLENNTEFSTVNNPVTDIVSHDINTEDRDTEAIHLHFDTEKSIELDSAIEPVASEAISELKATKSVDILENNKNYMETERINESRDSRKEVNEVMEVDHFSDDELNMDDIDNIIENAEIMKGIEDKVNSPLLLRDIPMNAKPKLTGAPGMVIDLDGGNPLKPKKSGVELLKERFTFFAKLKSPEEMEREKEKKLKPGTLHLKLKQELEEKIAEQRSLEWAKRLEEEKQQQNELKVLRGEESDDEDDIDKIEAKFEKCETEKDNEIDEDVEEEEEIIEDDCEMKDKPRRKNAMLDDEAEVSDCDENEAHDDDDEVENNDDESNDDLGNDEDNESESDSDESETSEEEEEQTNTKKGRILKAFEDSDDEDGNKIETENTLDDKVTGEPTVTAVLGSQPISQDDDLQLAQKQAASDDLFTSQESSILASQTKDTIIDTQQSVNMTDMDLGTQTFSILESSKDLETQGDHRDLNYCATQNSTDEPDLVIPGIFTQNILPLPITQTDTSQSQPIGEDILALCTGKFYDNQFVSQSEINNDPEPSQDDNFICDSLTCTEKSQEIIPTLTDIQSTAVELNIDKDTTDQNISEDVQVKEIPDIVDDNLKSILEELADPEFDSPKPNKFFCGNKAKDSVPDSQVKKKFIIDSDDETNEVSEKKRKKFKKKKLEQRALQFSDDEDEEIEQEDEYDKLEIENEEDPNRLVDYDSEENEIEIKPGKPKKQRKVVDFFEDEAELTSEDEWVGSGDENEAGLDRMEREEGDNEVFHQGKLQRELGQIHIRDVLDQDKREVRMIQELLFEDGDLGGGGRQRKFRWKNLDGEDESGTVVSDLIDSQEDQESEEQWRKQRHEREMFLRQMQCKEDNDSLNISVNISTKLSTYKEKLTEKTESIVVTEKKTVKDIPSPKKPFILLQQKYSGSLLSRGQGALARLAALAAPLAVDDDSHKPQTTSRRNFVFAAISQNEDKVTVKRKAESNPSTPKLIKKMKTEEKKNTSKSSLLDHFKV